MREILIATFGGIGSLPIPYLAYQYADYKTKKSERGKKFIRQKLSYGIPVVACLIGLILGWINAHEMALWKSLFCVLFYWFAVFGICVDSSIRIIGNEMLIAMFGLGVCYRFLEGGLSSFLGSLVGLVITVGLFAAAAGITFIRRMSSGVGMGDVKLAMVISITVGWPDVLNFLGGMAVVMVLYITFSLFSKRLLLHSTLPMCGPIMAGFLIALYQPQVQTVLNML
jgi:leader peptidase (prepilin peptidase)/N-methyltransferase